MRRKVGAATGIAAAALGVAAVVWAGWLAYQVLAHSAARPLQPADAIVVLGSAVWPGEQPSPSLAARTGLGIRLHQQGLASHLILTGGLGRWPPAEAEVMRRMAVSAGVPLSALVLDTQSLSTEESLRNARDLMDLRGWRTAILVSDPFHLYRALTMAGDLGMQAVAAPASDSPTWTILRLRAYYTVREVLALMAYHVLHPLGMQLRD